MLYLIKGDEPLLIQDAINNIPGKKKVFDIPDQKSLEEALFETQSPSLFDDPQEKINYIFKTNKNLKNLPEKIKVINIFPLSLKQFPDWAQKRFEKAGFKISIEIKKLLCDHFEGNTLALDQCLKKIKLLYKPDTVLTEAQILEVLTPAARYNVFDLIHHLGSNKVLAILETLREEGTEPAIVLWVLAKEARRRKAGHILESLVDIDDMIKGIKKGNIWEALLRTAFLMTGRNLP